MTGSPTNLSQQIQRMQAKKQTEKRRKMSIIGSSTVLRNSESKETCTEIS